MIHCASIAGIECGENHICPNSSDDLYQTDLRNRECMKKCKFEKEVAAHHSELCVCSIHTDSRAIENELNNNLKASSF